MGYAIPLLAIYPLLKIPYSWGASRMLTMAFVLGMVLDWAANTPGLQVIALTSAMMIRHIYRLIALRDFESGEQFCSTRSLGVSRYIYYTIAVVVTYITLLFVIESFTMFYPLQILLRIVSSSVLTLLLIFFIESFKLYSE